MSRLPGFALTFLSVLLTSLPAMAGQLVNWNFNASQNRFTFYTNSRVQPTAQLIPNPTRIVVDLPGTTLSGPTVRQPGSGRVREIRIGEPDSFTTRVVIELEAGYTVDPQQVKVRGITPTQWVVELPTPELAPASNNNAPAPNPDGSSLPSQNLSAANSPSTGQQDLQITGNGLFVRLDKNGDNSNIRIQPNARQSTVNFELAGAVLPESLVGQSLPVGEYGVEEIKFSDNPNNPRLSLALADSGGGWNAYYSRVGGGVVLLPKQINRSGSSNRAPGSAAVPVSNNTSNSSPSSSGNRSPNDRLVSQASNRNFANITAIEVTRDDSQLIIRGDRQISARGNFNRLTGNYEIRLDRAQLSPRFQSPELVTGAPFISSIFVRRPPIQF
ncbi:AMIN domain-containing protein [Synechocystis salina]|uniref:AMIN domain-containing protein n=1 Tax=Synechocystis salina TaxID=945780 RepID=UPI001D14ED4B|nr:AMIN domain-containing protein [Synechocystis salina]